jgi:hypothetical protein
MVLVLVLGIGMDMPTATDADAVKVTEKGGRWLRPALDSQTNQ